MGARPAITLPAAWASAIHAFLDGPEATELGESAAKHYRWHLTHLAQGLGSLQPAAVTLNDLEAYAAASTWAASTLDQSTKVARAFFRWAESHELVERSPFRDVVVVDPCDMWHPAWSEGLEAVAVERAQRGTSEATIETYRKHVGWLATAVCGDDPWEVTPAQIRGWIETTNWSKSTLGKVMVSLRAFYAVGIRNVWCQKSPLAGISGVPGRKRGPEQIKAPPLWQQPISGYLDWVTAGNRSSGTLDVRRWWLIRLAETYADPWAVSAKDIVTWLSRDDWKRNTKRSGRSAARGFYDWAEMEGL
jgi:hypothetical protein